MNHYLFSTIRRGMGLSREALAFTEEELADLYRFAAKQSLLPIVWQGIKELDISSEWKQRFDTGCAKDVRAYVLRSYSLGQIREALDGVGIPYILLKGSVICELYPEPWMRTSCDIDILVHEEDLNKAVETIEAKTEYKTEKKAYHDVSMLSQYFHLELHFNIKENSEKIDKLLSEVWEFAEPTGAGAQYALTPEYQIFHVVAHMCHHFLHGGLGIRPFVDLWLLRKKTQYDEERVRQMCDSCGLLKFYEASSKLAACWMENEPAEGELESFESCCLQGGVFGSRQQANAIRQKNKKGLGYLLSRVFIPDYNAREFYRDKSGKEHGYLYYQIKRWKSWLGKDRREELRKQTRAVLTADGKAIAATQNLMKWLEL